ncbi:hypothetical protein DYB36_008023 [Aphanomyces astaci]|uniref:Mannose-6-phosphate isomerase n=1 Tax=Aphanomyces astaci TaxID=112090 RepID=A0A397BBZ0_APHAT|nr:hypothetical protein DYB36_008023 [Aphanomyces astaci]
MIQLQENPWALGNTAKDIPYLFKVLSVNQALSIQAHPDKSAAKRLHKDFPHIYKDDNHKPEMAIALTHFEALCQFRPMDQIIDHITHVEEFRLLVDSSVAMALVDFKDLPSLRAFFRAIIYCDPDKATSALESLRSRLGAQRESLSALDALVLRLNEQYPNDIGAFSPYLLSYVVLEPGDAVFLGANEPHAYLSGECVECMAGSDNVVRAGLTPKFIDKATLVDMLTYTVGSPPVQRGKQVDAHLTQYSSPVPEFQVQRMNLPPSTTYDLAAATGPSILLVLEGQGTANVHGATTHDVGTGQVFFVPAGHAITFKSRQDERLVVYRSSPNENVQEYKKGKKGGAKQQSDEPLPLHPLRLEVGRLHHGTADPRAAQVISRINMRVQDMKPRGLSSGDLVVVSAETVPPTPVMCGTVWPSDKTKPGMVVLGSVWKEVAERAQSQSVTVSTLSSAALTRAVASNVTLQSLATVPISEKEQSLLGQYVACMMIGMYVLDQAILVLPVHGVSRRFQVTQCSTKSNATASSSIAIYSVESFTSIQVQWTPSSPTVATTARQSTPAFHAIGGLQTQIEAVRQLIEQPLINPSLFASFGLPPPKGVLLYGPPGTGKTLIARAVAAAARAAVFTINGPELLSKFVGESEANIRAVFAAAAAQSPALVFIDEIDSLCPKRDSHVGDMEKRVVATLLTCMDGLNASAGVVVLAATNRPNALDPALRRPGRLDREIEIPIPSAQDRLAILKVTLAKIPHALSPSLMDAIASQLHGYVGADISALCKEAALLALQRNRHEMQVTEADVKAATKLVSPSALREISLDIPRVLWSEIGGQGLIKQQLKEAVEWPLKHPDAFVRMGIRPPKGILLYGPPGCSKTLTAKALATEGGMNFIAIKGPELYSKWVGESEKAIQSIFRKAKAAAPSVVFFDEIDAVASSRGSGSSGVRVADRVLSQLLNELDGIEPLKQVILVAATNRPDLIDSALMRPGRIDRVLYVGPPDQVARAEILRIHTRKMPLASDVSMEELAQKTPRYSGAELASLCREAALCAMQEDVQALNIAKRHFDLALAQIVPQINDAMLGFFDAYRESHAGA